MVDESANPKKRRPKPPAPERDKRRKITPESEAAHAMAPDLKQRFRYHHDTERWYGYHKATGTWRPIVKTIVWSAVATEVEERELAPNGYGAGYVDSLVGVLRARLGIFAWSKQTGFANGLLVDGEIVPHSPSHLILHALPFPYEPTATCEPIVAWILDRMGGDGERVHILRCYLHAIVNGRADIQVFLELLGPGGSGKGTFMRLCVALVGKHATVATELKRLEEIRFEPATCRDKLLIQINDSDRYGGEVSMLKRLTGGDDIPFEEKGKQSTSSFQATGMVIITCNEAIRSSDYTSALVRRRITIKFDRPIDMNHARDLEEEFAPYLPGLYNWVMALDPVQVAKDLRSASRRVRAIAKAQAEVELATNPIAAWAMEKLYYWPGARAKVGDARRVPGIAGESPSYIDNHGRWLYASYCQWSDGTGSQPVSVGRFSNNLLDLLQNQMRLPRIAHKTTKWGAFFFGVSVALAPADDDDTTIPRDGSEPIPLEQARERFSSRGEGGEGTQITLTAGNEDGKSPGEGGEGGEGIPPHVHAHVGAHVHMRREGTGVKNVPSPSPPSPGGGIGRREVEL